jgi:hypothetical protein
MSHGARHARDPSTRIRHPAAMAHARPSAKAGMMRCAGPANHPIHCRHHHNEYRKADDVGDVLIGGPTVGPEEECEKAHRTPDARSNDVVLDILDGHGATRTWDVNTRCLRRR